MDKTKLVASVANLFRLNGHSVETSVRINHREIDVVAHERHGLVRKMVLIECADYSTPVGVQKIQDDISKLSAARESLQENAVIMHVSRNGYSPDASGYALDKGVEHLEYDDLDQRLVNFDDYIEAVEADSLRNTILNEYQPTKLQFDGKPKSARTALKFIDNWIGGESRWLTVLGDYGVGKSWMLKRYLYHSLDKYKEDKRTNPLPFFVPLQQYTKAFDYQNLILRTFQIFGLAGVSYDAFQYLAKQGRVIFLFDSFDEMAQHLSRDVIRENLHELLAGISGKSRAIMTSRPTYFEGRAERLLAQEADGALAWHQLDLKNQERKSSLGKLLERNLDKSQYGRLNDLTEQQRKKLFGIVLGTKTDAYRTLMQLLDRFTDLDSISQRAVFARLLTTVAETLSSGKEISTIEGYPLLPDDLRTLNQAKIFEIVVYNLLHRDQGIGQLTAAQRLTYLRTLAVRLQQLHGDMFISPADLRTLVRDLFKSELRRSDSPEQLLENYYRACRRHSGLTTENQFRDTSGQLDMPVDEDDQDSRIGFSHNSLREYLVAEALADFVKNGQAFEGFSLVIVSDATGELFTEMTAYDDELEHSLKERYINTSDLTERSKLFDIAYAFKNRDIASFLKLIASPAQLESIDLSGKNLSGLPLKSANFNNTILPDTDLRSCDLRGASFRGAVFDGTLLDGARLEGTDLSEVEIDSIFVYDEFDTETTAILKGKPARQWLYSRGAIVSKQDDLNPLLGRPWYKAAREVTKTLRSRIAGSHQDVSLAKGTSVENREFAKEFVDYLIHKGVLVRGKKSKKGPGWILKIPKEHWGIIDIFCDEGKIPKEFSEFFNKYLKTKN